MFTFLGRAVLVVSLLLAFVPSGRAEVGVEHLVMGNPSAATADKDKPDNFLLRKRQYVLSYNNSKGTPNWVSWHLSRKWLGTTRRGNPFAPDTALPAGFFVVRPNDYRGSGFDRGHMCPAADRSVSKEDMDATFLMTNMVPQSPDENRKTWEKMEAYCRDQARDDKELYIVAGPAGQGGIGSDGARTLLPAKDGKIVVPAKCWKVVLVLPADTTHPRKVTEENARVFAAIMPNSQGLDTDWRDYAVSVKDVEKLTGCTFFSTLPARVAEQLRSRKPETRAKGTTGTKEKKPPKKGEVEGELASFKKGCVVGNRKSKIYHIPGSRGYETATKSKNAIFFRDTKAAEKAGYTESKR